MKRFILALFLVVACIELTACHQSAVSTPAPPNSPQTQVLNITKTLADAINAAVRTGITLRDQGTLSQEKNLMLQNWAKSAVMLDDRIATELASGEAWIIQRGKVLALLPGFQLPEIGGVDPQLRAEFALVAQLVGQIQSQVKP